MEWRVLSGEGGLGTPGARREQDRLRLPDGSVLLELSGPRRRRWAGVRLEVDEPVPALPTDSGWQFAGRAELDVLHLPPGVVPTADAAALTVPGAFTELGGWATLGRFLVGGQLLDPTLFGGARCPSEQTALGLYRVARHRGGPFWDGVATLVADWTAGRVRAGTLVHDLLGQGETHTRFVADAVLLLTAHGYGEQVALAVGQLEALAVGQGRDRWWRHDSLEDGSDLVLNTHLLALLARRAAGVDDDAGEEALHAALRARPGRGRALAHAADLLVGDLARGALDGRRHPWVADRAHAAEARAARERHRRPHLVLPGGRTARDVRPEPAPAYHTVNVADLASYALVTGDALAQRRALAGARYARASGHWRSLLRDGDPVVLLVPAALQRLGLAAAAQRWADRLVAAGMAPALGWPGLLDQPWPRLPAGAL